MNSQLDSPDINVDQDPEEGLDAINNPSLLLERNTGSSKDITFRRASTFSNQPFTLTQATNSEDKNLISSTKIILESKYEIQDPSSLNYLNINTENTIKNNPISTLRLNEYTSDDQEFNSANNVNTPTLNTMATPSSEKHRFLKSPPLDDFKQHAQAMRLALQPLNPKSLSLAKRPEKTDSMTSSELNDSPPKNKGSLVLRRLMLQSQRSSGLSRMDTLGEESYEGEGSRSSGKRWRKIMVLVNAVSKMKKTQRSAEGADLTKKQLELLNDFDPDYNPNAKNVKLEANGKLKKQFSMQEGSNSRLEWSVMGAQRGCGYTIYGINVMCSIITTLLTYICCCFMTKKGDQRILPEAIARSRIRVQQAHQEKQLWEVIKKPIDPSGKFRLPWDLFIMSLVLADMIILPLQIAFSVLDQAELYEYFSNTMFILDIALNFHTGYYQHGEVIKDHKDIARHYLKGWLFVDILSALPLYALDNNDPVQSNSGDIRQNRPTFLKLFRIFRLLKILRALRFLKLSKIFWKIRVFFSSSQARSGFELFKLLIIVLLLSHWLACIWYFVAILELEFTDNVTWIDNRGIIDADTYVKYTNSIYWAVTTMLTVGYGDIVPASVPELWTAVCSMFVACGVFAFSLNTIGRIVREFGQDKLKIR